jgi:ribonuclease P protein subunit POP4
MRVTPEVVRCELIGTEVGIAQSTHTNYRGLAGRIINETRNTFTVLGEKGRKIVVKSSNVFHFSFLDGTVVEIDGNLLVGRPEDRLKRSIRRLW